MRVCGGKIRPVTNAELFSYHFVHIYRASTLWGRISAPVAALINTTMKGVVSDRHAEKKMIVTMNSKEVLKRRADARFKQEERALDGRKAMTEYEAQALATREKTARLRALRLAKEAQVQSEAPPPKTKVRPLKKPRESITAL